MRVLQVSKGMFPVSEGGIERTVSELHDRLKFNFGWTSRILTLGISCDSCQDVTFVSPLFNFLSCPFPNFKFVYEFVRLVRDSDIVIVHYPWPVLELLSLLICPKKVVIWYHCDVRRYALARIFQFPIAYLLSRLSLMIVVHSPQMGENSLIPKLNKNKVLIVPSAFTGSIGKEISGNICGVAKGTTQNYFLFIGRRSWYKGLDVLDRASRIAKIDVVVIGKGTEDFPFASPFVKVKGEVSDDEKNWFLRHCKGVVLPSTDRAEAYGLALVEGLKFGKPIVAPEVGTGTSFLALHAGSMLVNPGDEVDLASAMLVIANSNKSGRWERLSESRYLLLENQQREGFERFFEALRSKVS